MAYSLLLLRLLAFIYVWYDGLQKKVKPSTLLFVSVLLLIQPIFGALVYLGLRKFTLPATPQTTPPLKALICSKCGHETTTAETCHHCGNKLTL